MANDMDYLDNLTPEDLSSSDSRVDWSALRREFEENGVVKIPGFYTPEVMAQMKKCYDETLNRPVQKSTVQAVYPDGSHYNPASGYRTDVPRILELCKQGPWPKMLQELWGSKNVWFFDHEIWWKKFGSPAEGRNPGRSDTPFHQDSRVVPFSGGHTAIIWMAFESVKKENCLQVVKGSHKWPYYVKPPQRPGDKSLPMDNTGAWKLTDAPIMPQTNADHCKITGSPLMPDSWERMSWDLEPGDVICFHGHAIHGGAPAGPGVPERNTLVLRFCGDDCQFTDGLGMWSNLDKYKGLKEGDHFAKHLPREHLLVGLGLTDQAQTPGALKLNDAVDPHTGSKL